MYLQNLFTIFRLVERTGCISLNSIYSHFLNIHICICKYECIIMLDAVNICHRTLLSFQEVSWILFVHVRIPTPSTQLPARTCCARGYCLIETCGVKAYRLVWELLTAWYFHRHPVTDGTISFDTRTFLVLSLNILTI